jgi:putative transposase
MCCDPGGVRPVVLPPQSPNLNAFAERWVRSVKPECLSKLILFGEGSLRRALTEYIAHFHSQRNHQGKENRLLFPACAPEPTRTGKGVRCDQRLGGLLRYYARAA